MNNNDYAENRRSGRFLAIGGILIVATVLGILFAAMSYASAGTFGAQPAVVQGGWVTVFEETFESELGPEWSVHDVDAGVNGEYYWARTSNAASSGSFSAWATGGGAEGSSLEPGVDDYPHAAGSVMVHEPVDLSDQNGARLVFDVWYKTQPAFDILQVAASTDGTIYLPLGYYSGDSGGWITEVLDMSAYAGEPIVYLRFYFSTDADISDKGAYLDNIRLESFSTVSAHLPLIRFDPTPTPTPTPPPYYYFDDFSDPSSGWPIVDHTWNPKDCYKWYYYGTSQTYRNDICDDRTDVKASPGVELPSGDYVIEVDGRFRLISTVAIWWTSYGVLFDAKDDPDPSKPDLGDYYMLWVLWEGEDKHLWKILRDYTGGYEDVTPWRKLEGSYYDYGNDGTNFNHWRIERTNSRIRVYVNGHKLDDIREPRPTTNYQVLFGLYSATYETNVHQVGYDNYLVDLLSADANADRPYWSWSGEEASVYSSGDFELEHLLPTDGIDLEKRE